jgi:hypothetical protein
MTNTKTATLSLRIDPGVKEGLRMMAEQEHRSLANMVEVMIRDYCRQHNINVPEQQNLFSPEEQ